MMRAAGREVSRGLNRMEGEEGDFGAAIEAEGNSHAAYAAVHVELRRSQLKNPLNVLAASGRKPQRTDDWQPHLAAMGMAAQNQGNCLTCGVHTQPIDIIRRMAHQDDGFVGDISDPGRNGLIQVRLSAAGVVEPSKPEP